MPDNPAKDYKDYILANLPSDVTVDPKDGFFIYNNHKFPTWLQVKWYRDYVRKYRKRNNLIGVSGGTVTYFNRDNVNYAEVLFSTSGTITLTSSVEVQYALGAGGGAGGKVSNTTSYVPGGGGAGGLIVNKSGNLLSGNYSVTIGAGAPSTSINTGVTKGSDSTFIGSNLNLLAYGGGFGASVGTGMTVGADGGSGGGGRGYNGTGTSLVGGAGVAGQGFAGGSGFQDGTTQASSGGGGGSGSAGSDGSAGVAGLGGSGTLLDWIATPTVVCSGGSGTLLGVTETTPDATWGSGSKGTSGGTTYFVGKGGDGFMFLVFKADEVTII